MLRSVRDQRGRRYGRDVGPCFRSTSTIRASFRVAAELTALTTAATAAVGRRVQSYCTVPPHRFLSHSPFPLSYLPPPPKANKKKGSHGLSSTSSPTTMLTNLPTETELAHTIPSAFQRRGTKESCNLQHSELYYYECAATLRFPLVIDGRCSINSAKTQNALGTALLVVLCAGKYARSAPGSLGSRLSVFSTVRIFLSPLSNPKS
jgi:hypothetical protein